MAFGRGDGEGVVVAGEDGGSDRGRHCDLMLVEVVVKYIWQQLPEGLAWPDAGGGECGE